MATKVKSAAKTKIASVAPKRELRSWTIGENSNQIGTIKSLKFGTNNNGTAQVKVAVTAGRTANGNVNWFYAEALGKIAENFNAFSEGDRVAFYSTFECSEYTNRFGETEFYLSHKILFVEAA
jgi:hypothetical protein